MLVTMFMTFKSFWTLTNSIWTQFKDSMMLMVLTIINHVRLKCNIMWLSNRLCKLMQEQHLFNFIPYFKHHNVIMCDVFMWNRSKPSMCNDVLVISPCINEAYCEWDLMDNNWRKGYIGYLEFEIENLLGCIKFIDKTSAKIHKPWNNVAHQTSFNNKKKLYLMNNRIIVDD